MGEAQDAVGINSDCSILPGPAVWSPQRSATSKLPPKMREMLEAQPNLESSKPQSPG